MALETPPPARTSAHFFAAGLLLALTVGTTLGAVMLATMVLPVDLLGGLPLAAVKTAHAHAQVFGFAALFVMGVAYHVVPRFTGTRLATPLLADLSFWLQVGGVVTVSLGVLSTAPFAPAVRLGGNLLLVAAAVSFAWTIHRTLAAGSPPPQPQARYLRAGCLWLILAACLAARAALDPSGPWQAASWEVALWGFTGSWIFGMSLRVLPTILGLRWAHHVFDDVTWGAVQLGTLAWVAGSLIPTYRGLGGALLSLALMAFVGRLTLLVPSRTAVEAGPGAEKFLLSAYGWLLVAIVGGPLSCAMAALTGDVLPPLLLDFGRHAFALGFLTQMIIGVAMRVIPMFSGAKLWSTRWRDATYYLLNAAVLVRGLQVVAFWGVDAVWPYTVLSGPLGVAAFVTFAVNVMMTRRSLVAAAVAR